MILDHLGCSCEVLQAFLTETEDCALHPSLICAKQKHRFSTAFACINQQPGADSLDQTWDCIAS